MKSKKNLIIVGIVILLAIIAVLTVWRMGIFGTRPIAPSAPESKPKAATGQIPANITPAAGCMIGPFTKSLGPTQPPCSGKIQGMIFEDLGDPLNPRASDREMFGPVSFRIDYQRTGINYSIGPVNGICSGGASCYSSCSPSSDRVSSQNGGYTTGPLTPGGENYNLRIVLNDSNWIVSKAYVFSGSGCSGNPGPGGRVLVVDPPQASTAYVYGINPNCGTTNVWFGVKQKVTACLIPSPKPVLQSSTHSKVDLKWNCDQTGVDCYALERYEYNVSGSCPGGKTCGEPPSNPVATIILPPRAAGVPPTTPCTYSDEITQDKDKCVAYKIVAKDYNTTKTCENCTAGDGTNCCLIKSDPVKICGLPKQSTWGNRVAGTANVVITWTDNSAIEDGYKIYRRESGNDNFDPAIDENPIKIRSANTQTFTDDVNAGTGFEVGKKNAYRYSVRAFTDSCGCGVPTNTPTPSPTSTLPACLNVQTTISTGGDLNNLKAGDVLTFTVNFGGTVEDVAVIIKKDGNRIATFSAGSSKTNTWTSPAYTISSLGSYEVIALIKVGGAWK